eukprot:777508-Amphidinium_carterae.1
MERIQEAVVCYMFRIGFAATLFGCVCVGRHHVVPPHPLLVQRFCFEPHLHTLFPSLALIVCVGQNCSNGRTPKAVATQVVHSSSLAKSILLIGSAQK